MGNMFLGEYTHKIDDKKRLTLPKAFLKELGSKVVLTRGLDESLFLYPLKEWKNVEQSIRAMSFTNKDARDFARFMLAGAMQISVDRSGRILIPDHLKDFAGLKSKVVFAGVSSRIELWDEGKWQRYTKSIEKNADLLAEKLSEVGVL